jgi:hypothetical protein
MKMQLKSMLLLIGVSFITFTGFKNADVRGPQALHVNATPTPVTITAVFDFSTFPNVAGTFTASGALEISGDATMDVALNENGKIAHCVVTLIASDGTITIHQECQFVTNPPKGRWEIVSGTGAYANLQGNGSLTMPPNTEAMEGVIY